MSDQLDLADYLLHRAGAAGADGADVLVSEGRGFQVTVRKGEVETLKEAGGKALGVRVFVGRRTATAHTSDFSKNAVDTLIDEAIQMARATSEDPAAGLPDEVEPIDIAAESLEMYDASLEEVSTQARIDDAREAEQASFDASDEITNSQGASYASDTGSVALANSLGFRGSYRSSSASLSVVPIAQRNGAMERDYWYSAARHSSDLQSPKEIGRIAAERALRRLAARKPPTCEVPVVFDPEAAVAILGHIFGALSGYSVFRNATFLKDRLGESVASPLLSIVDDSRRVRGLGSRPFDGEGSRTRVNRPLDAGVLKHYMCDWYSGRKLGLPANGCARRGVGGAPSVGASNLYFEPGDKSAEEIIGEVESGLLVTDLIGFGVNLVTGDYSQGAVGHWIEGGQLQHPVSELTIAGNLKQMLLDVDAVGSDLDFRRSVASPTLRIRRMIVSGS